MRRFIGRFSGATALTSVAALLCFSSMASAQFAGFNVRFINVTSEQVNNHTEALQMVGDPRTEPKAFTASFDGSDNYPTINFAGGNNFGGDHNFPGGAGPGTDFNDFILYATAEVTVPAGDWIIGFGSDDGGQLTLTGSGLECIENCNDGGELPFESGDMIHFNGNRGHNWTIGESSGDGGTYDFSASMHERGGGDSLEVAIINADDWSGGFNIDEGWQLLGDGVMGWGVSTDKTGEISVAGGDLGELFASANDVRLVRGESLDDTYSPGLAQEWSRSGNQGSKLALEQSRFDAGVEPAAFRADGTDWWAGSATYDTIPKYQENLEEAGYNLDNNDQYSVRLTGEIKFDADGTYRFRDGVDDYTYMALDLDRSGVAGDAANEVLVDDNAWTGVDGVRNGTEGDGPSPLVEVEIDVADDAEGEWIAVEFLMAEGGGGDAGTLFWNGLDLENDQIATPGTVMDDPDLLVPQSHTRSKLPGPVEALNSTAKLGDDGRVYKMQVSSDLLDSDHIVFNGGTLDVTGVVINVEASGELVAGDSWVLIIGEDVVGADTVTYNFANPDAWDLSQLATTGRIIYTGAEAAASVPEPTGLALFGFGSLLLGVARRRRK